MNKRILIPAKRPGHAQRGAILVTSMLLLLILTILGIAMMKMTNMQERMAGNTRDMAVALQAADAALRDGEDLIRAQVNYPNPMGAGGCVFCQQGVLPIAIDNPTLFDWAAEAQEFGVDGANEFPELTEDPRFIIEEAGYDPDDLNEGHELPTGRQFYAVTGRSTGASGLANVVLQSTYARRF